MTDVVVNNMIEVTLPSEQDFLKVKETLTRMGIPSRKTNTLYQSCHILHKQGKYYICHFKEMFLLDGREADFSDEDKSRRNLIASRLQEWGLVKIVDEKKVDSATASAYIKIIPFKEKADWELVAKYNVGKKKKVQPDA